MNITHSEAVFENLIREHKRENTILPAKSADDANIRARGITGIGGGGVVNKKTGFAYWTE
jgi:hypothetical protein